MTWVTAPTCGSAFFLLGYVTVAFSMVLSVTVAKARPFKENGQPFVWQFNQDSIEKFYE
jgi:hypothetical protein